MFINRVMVIGNATNNATLRETGTGKKVANFTVATNEYWKSPVGEQMSESELHYITAWDRLGEIAHTIVQKGRKVYVEGRKRTTTFTREGQEVERVEIVAHKIMTLEKAKQENDVYEGGYNGNF